MKSWLIAEIEKIDSWCDRKGRFDSKSNAYDHPYSTPYHHGRRELAVELIEWLDEKGDSNAKAGEEKEAEAGSKEAEADQEGNGRQLLMRLDEQIYTQSAVATTSRMRQP